VREEMSVAAAANGSAACAILAIAGTGSTTLHDSFAAALLKQHEQTAPLVRKVLNVHDHTLAIRNTQGASCFVTTLRDPVAHSRPSPSTRLETPSWVVSPRNGAGRRRGERSRSSLHATATAPRRAIDTPST
jgi:hypothetical protein